MPSTNQLQNNSRSMNGLNTVNADAVYTDTMEVNTLTVDTQATAPTPLSTDNSTKVATTAFVQGAISTSGTNYVNLTGNQVITGTKTIKDTQLLFSTTGNPNLSGFQLVGTEFQYTGDDGLAFYSGAYSNITSTSDFNVSVFGSAVHTVLNMKDNGGNNLMSFDCFNTGNYIQSNYDLYLKCISNTGAINIGNNGGFGGYINIGRIGATTSIPTMNGKYITLFAGMLRMWSGTSGGSSIYMYVPPSGRTIVDYSSTDCDTVGQVNMTSNNITCSVAPTSANEYCNKTYVDSVANYTNLLSSNNTWTGSNTFNNFAVNQTTGNIDETLNSNTQKKRLIRGTNSLDMYFTGGTAYSTVIENSSATSQLMIKVGSGATAGAISMQPSGGLGAGPEIDLQATVFVAGNLWLDGTSSGLKSFGTNNIPLYTPFSYSYNPSTITWGTPSANTINGWTNSPVNIGDNYSGTASDNSTPANVGQIILPSPGIWFIQMSALLTLNTGSDTITDRTVVVSEVSGTNGSPCMAGFKYTDPIDDGAGNNGPRQTINFSGIYHYITASSGSKTLYINAIAITSGSRTVTVSGEYKFTRLG